jgi:hypothetical protein
VPSPESRRRFTAFSPHRRERSVAPPLGLGVRTATTSSTIYATTLAERLARAGLAAPMPYIWHRCRSEQMRVSRIREDLFTVSRAENR